MIRFYLFSILCAINSKNVINHFSCQAVQNLGLATVIILAGMIVDKYGYLMLEMFFLCCLFGKFSVHIIDNVSMKWQDLIEKSVSVSLIAAVLIYIVDSTNNGILNLPPSKRDSMKP